MLYTGGKYGCKGVSGFIVGSTDAAGNCVLAKATRNGYAYYAVVLKGETRNVDRDSEKENCAMMDCRSVFNWAFSNIRYTTLVKEMQIIGEVEVHHSADGDHVAVAAKETLNLFVPSNIGEGSVLIEPIDLPESINAPVKQGDFICKASVKYAGEELAKIDLVAAQDVGASALLFLIEKFKALAALPAMRIMGVLVLVLLVGYIGLNILMNYRKTKKRRMDVVNPRDIGNRKR